MGNSKDLESPFQEPRTKTSQISYYTIGDYIRDSKIQDGGLGREPSSCLGVVAVVAVIWCQVGFMIR